MARSAIVFWNQYDSILTLKMREKDSSLEELSGEEAYQQVVIRHAKYYSQFGKRVFSRSIRESR